MLKEIFIEGHEPLINSLKVLLDKRQNLDAIIITNYGIPLPEWIIPQVKTFLHLDFDDITYALRSYVLPKKENIQLAFDFSEEKESIVVACHARFPAGISRSSAIAYLIACKEWGIDKALTILDRNIHYPNALIVKLGSEILKDKNIWDKFCEWQLEHTDFHPEDAL